MDGQNRVTTKREEIIPGSDISHAKDTRPDSGKREFGRRGRRDVVSLGRRLRIRIGQRTAIEFAIARQRHALKQDERRRHHVVGQQRFASPTQRARVRRPPCGRDAVRHEPPALSLQAHRHIAQSRGSQHLLDLGKRSHAKIVQNLFWAFVYNVIGIPIAAGALYPATGLQLSPVFASAAMAFSSVSVVTNSLRLRRARVA
mgnify:CR=1 FL=1